MDFRLPLSGQRGNCEGHCDPVIFMAVNDSAVERFSTVDDHAVFRLFDISAHRTQVFDHDGDPVGFLYFQFGGVADHGGTFCKTCHHGDRRKFVDERRDDIPFDGAGF